MTAFFEMFFGFVADLIGTLDRFSFEISGIPVTLPSLIFAFLVIGFVVSIFWKGART